MAASDSATSGIVESLGKASLMQNTEVSFAGRGLKLDKAEDGKKAEFRIQSSHSAQVQKGKRNSVLRCCLQKMIVV